MENKNKGTRVPCKWLKGGTAEHHVVARGCYTKQYMYMVSKRGQDITKYR